MRSLLAKLTGNPWLLKCTVVLVLLVAVGTGGYYYGKQQAAGKVAEKESDLDPFAKVMQASKSSGRVVAYLYDTVPVSREEFADYLIARVGPEKLDYMLSRKIVEMECRKHGIYATDAEVEERFQKELKSFGPTALTREQFINGVLKQVKKTEYEWREDVIRPELMMKKLVRQTIKITDKDIQEGFEARYGPRVECRMIVINRENLRLKTQIWEEARKSSASFMEQARKQPIPNLAAEAGKVPPIHRFFGDKSLEDAAFALKEGEVSSLIELKDGSVVMLLCEKHIPANKLVTLTAEVRTQLYEEMFEMRVAQRIPEVFREMRHFANPRPVLSSESPIVLTSHTPPPIPVSQNAVQPAVPQTVIIPPPPTPGKVIVPKGVEAAPILPSTPLPAPKDIAPPMPTTAVTPMPTTAVTPMPTVTPTVAPVVTPPMPETKKK